MPDTTEKPFGEILKEQWEAKKKELMEIVADLSSNDKAYQLSSIAGQMNLVSKQ